MPQKRNPVALEHARAIASKALGEAQAVITTVHNTPFGDIVDTEDDLQPLVASMFHDATRAAGLVAAALASAELDTTQLEAHAADGWTTLTELADTLVRDYGLPFSKAHAIAGRLTAAAPGQGLSPLLADASASMLGTPLVYTEERLREVLSARHFIAVRGTWGGPAPDMVERALADARGTLEIDREWSRVRADALAAADVRLAERSRAL
jgi:argininosuccinate lyase